MAVAQLMSYSQHEVLRNFKSHLDNEWQRMIPNGSES